MRYFNRKIGTINLINLNTGNVLWLNVIRHLDDTDYRISFNLSTFEDNEYNEFFKTYDITFTRYRCGGGIRCRVYYKYLITLKNEEQLIATINDIKQKCNQGKVTITINKDIDHILNEFHLLCI